MTNKIRKLTSLLAVVFLLCLVAPSAFSQAGKGKLVTISIDSAALKGNMLGDPWVQEADVYLPPGYDADTKVRYPVFYLLHGYTGAKESWTKFGYQGLVLAESMDRLIAEGKAKEMIVVAPNASNSFFGSFYTDSAVMGNWRTYISRELVDRIDRDYRTIADPAARGVAGHSMGGYGAIMMGMTTSGIYGAVYALSPCCMGFEGDMAIGTPAWQAALAVTDLDAIRKPPITNFFAVANTALSIALSPNPENKEFFVSYPFRMDEGKMVPNEPAYSTFRSKMPIYLVDKYRDNLHGLRGLAIDVGEKEEFTHILATTRIFSQKLAEAGVPHTYSIYADGNHSGLIRKRLEDFVIPFFSRTLVDPKSSDK